MFSFVVFITAMIYMHVLSKGGYGTRSPVDGIYQAYADCINRKRQASGGI